MDFGMRRGRLKIEQRLDVPAHRCSPLFTKPLIRCGSAHIEDDPPA
jgi:hypothetical protein